MKKIYSRRKRKLGLSTHLGHSLTFGSRKKRPKSFKTEEGAHRYAASLGLKQGGYLLKKVKKGKKFQVSKIT